LKATKNTIFHQFGLIDQQSHHWIISLLIISLLILPFGFMTFKSLFGILSAICLLLSITALFIKPELINHFFKEKNGYLFVLCLISMPICIFLTQVIRGNISAAAYDGPLRLTAAFFVLLAIYKHRIDFSRISSLSIPLALVCILVYAKLGNNPYGERLTNNYLDPIIWGNFSVILGFISLASIQSKDQLLLKAYKLSGFFLGLSMSLLSQSRSGWIASIIMALTLLIMNRKELTLKKIAGYLLGLIFILLALYFFIDTIKLRFGATVSEFFDWQQNSQRDSSISIRLNMLKISSQLFMLSPWIGFGEFSTLPIEKISTINEFADPGSILTIKCCGPHNDLAAHALKFGIFGIASFFITYLIPAYIFCKSTNSQGSRMGIVLLTGILVCGFFSEMQSLKVANTFYAIFIAGLAATTFWKNK